MKGGVNTVDKIAIIGSGILAKVFADRAKEIGIETHCFSFDKNDVACHSVDYFHEIDICKKNGIGGVVATTELTILPVARVAKKLGLLGNRENVAAEITNKYLTRNKVSGVTGLSQPAFWVYQEGDIPNVNECLPVIVKPIAAGGKRGVSVVYDSELIESAVTNALSYSKVKGVLIEEYLDGGSEYSVESLSYKGKHRVFQVTQKDTSGPPHCNELGHHQPANISSEMRENVERVISGMLDAVGIENGPCHTEIKIINNKIYLIEINARPGGDHITYPLTELSTGYPYISAIMWAALGKYEEHKPQKLERNYCGIYFVTEETAYLKPVFDCCENYRWLYHKNKVSDEPSKIQFNDEENLNYFIYYDVNEKPNIERILLEINKESC